MIAPNGEASLLYRIAPKSPFLSVNRSHIRYDFRAGKKEIPYSVNTESVAEPSCFFFFFLSSYVVGEPFVYFD